MSWVIEDKDKDDPVLQAIPQGGKRYNKAVQEAGKGHQLWALLPHILARGGCGPRARSSLDFGAAPHMEEVQQGCALQKRGRAGADAHEGFSVHTRVREELLEDLRARRPDVWRHILRSVEHSGRHDLDYLGGSVAEAARGALG